MNTKHLKAKILDLAIRGKLVSQDSSEGNASDLLQKIREEKCKCHPELDSGSKQKKIKEDTKTAKSAASFIIKADDGKHYEQFADGSLKDIEDEIPFEIPENWCWCRLTSLCEYGKCKNADPSELLPDSWILDLEDIEKGTGVIKKFPTFAERNSLSTKHVFTKGTVLYSKLRPYLNKVVIAPKDGFCTSEILPLDFHGAYINKFVQRLLMSPYFLSTVNMLTYGVKMPRLGTGEANQILLPLPPLSEQKRIVSAIEKAFEQIDIIEKNKLNLKTYIKQTKSKVLDLAIHGKLVEQNPQEGNATDLLQKIREEKASHGLDFANAKSKKNKQQPETALAVSNPCDISDNEIPFEIPENWCWCRLETIFDFIGGGTPDKSKKEYWNGNIPWASVKDVKGNYLNKTLDTITELGLEAGSNLCHKDEIILVTRISPGKAIISNIETAINQDLKVARLKCELNKHYLQKCFTFFENQMHHDASGSTVKGIKLEYLNSFLFPLPPLSEQKRIVAKIEQVFEQLDVLEKSMGEYKIIEE